MQIDEAKSVNLDALRLVLGPFGAWYAHAVDGKFIKSTPKNEGAKRILILHNLSATASS
jgi:hypothetical protein